MTPTSRPTSHNAVAELLGAYALDAVDDDERRAVEDHLPTCPRCRDEVAQHREVAAHLAFSGVDAPVEVWERISANLSPAPDADIARLYPLRRSARRPWLVAGIGSVAAAAMLVVGLLGWQLHGQQQKVTAIRTALDAKVGLNQSLLAAMLDLKAERFTLRSIDNRLRIDAVLEPDGSGFLLPRHSLPVLPADQTYQMWGVVGGQRISLGLLGTAPDVVPFQAASRTIVALAVTAEKAGGVIQSSHAPVVVGFATPAGAAAETQG